MFIYSYKFDNIYMTHSYTILCPHVTNSDHKFLPSSISTSINKHSVGLHIQFTSPMFHALCDFSICGHRVLLFSIKSSRNIGVWTLAHKFHFEDDNFLRELNIKPRLRVIIVAACNVEAETWYKSLDEMCRVCLIGSKSEIYWK